MARLTAAPLRPPFHVVLVEPEIPPNTGNVSRLCVGTSTPLHLVGKLGFRIDAAAVKRAGLDHWADLELRYHADFPAFLTSYAALSPGGRLHLFSASATRSYLDAGFRPGDALVFGRESTGLPRELLEAHADRVVGIPMSGPARSLNLSNAVAVGLFEALRQVGGLAPQRSPDAPERV